MNNRVLGVSAMVAAGGLLLCCGTVIVPLVAFMGPAGASCAGGWLRQIKPSPSASGSVPGDWDSRATDHAVTIVDTGARKGIPPRGWVIALTVAMQESSLRNLANANVPASLEVPHDGVGTDSDSLGLFQQRPSPPEGAGSWGTVAEIMNPAVASGKFYDALQGVPGWQRMRLTEAGQRVQRSAYPDAYQKWEVRAERLAAWILGLDSIERIGGGAPFAPCGPGDFGPVPVGPGGWVQPLRATVVSPYGMRGGRLHAGVDLGGPREAPIRAAAGGRVQFAGCDDDTAADRGCDVDGSPATPGCGYFVEILHLGGVGTRYCHFVARPVVVVGQRVAAGEVIGFEGTSGHSSGPHLHFEVHVNVGCASARCPLNSANSVDPQAFMERVGAPLGKVAST